MKALIFLALLGAAYDFPDRLQCLRQPIIDDRICKNAYPHLLTDNMLCSGFMSGGASSCQVSRTEPHWISSTMSNY
ncbi:Cationic trypsin [Dissostichus eleginoides]|uniref:Cationic trypsin n=1 Tax=Dissostichus eleginoides TaxID=100907 RepID=A0AAD9BBN8_DISEL|nr:Cationic trypsin [Dissostichus eleginoides]